ncbi:MAG: glycosyl hydrolase family 28-related protein [Zavarzinella sp.]
MADKFIRQAPRISQGGISCGSISCQCAGSGCERDGITDDTAALQNALDQTCTRAGKGTRILYLPDGTYRISQTLVVNRNQNGSGLGPWMYGESRDGVIIRLIDGAKNCTSVIRTHPTDEGKTSANWFMRNIRNLTIDVGNNPQTDGIRYMATNTGMIQNVKIIGTGKNGINASFVGESGPNLIQDVTIDGFDVGIASAWMYGQTLSRIRISNCRKTGITVVANVMAIEDLEVINTPQALFVDYPNDWHWWSGVVSIINGKFATTNSQEAAIRNRGILFARNIEQSGYQQAIESSTSAGNVSGKIVKEYSSHGITKLFADSDDHSLNLPIKAEPIFAWETNPKNWVCANDFGANNSDREDDTAAIQKAIDSAAQNQQTVVYLRGAVGPEPNWFTVKGEIRVHGSVRHIIGLGFGRVLGGKWIVDESAPIVKFQHLDSFGGLPPTLENRSKKSTMVVESCGATIVGSGKGDIFVTDCPCKIRIGKNQSLWARHLNAEGEDQGSLVRNDGGTMWILGTKSEGKGTWFYTGNNGKSEIMGGYEYATQAMEKDDKRAIFVVEEGQMSIAAVREISFTGKPHPIKVTEVRNGVEQYFRKSNSWSLFTASKK